MNWYHAAGGAPQGPISEEQLRALAQQGVVTTETLVWREGLPAWQAYGSLFGGAGARTGLPPVAGAGAVLRPGERTCAECGRAFSEDNLLRYGDLWVCAACKPLFLQRVQEGAQLPGQALWRAGGKLVMLKTATLPDRCVKCNEPATPPKLRRNLYWHHPLYFLAILINLLVYVVIAVLVRKNAKIEIGLCARHWAARKRALVIAWSLFGASLALIAGSIYFESLPLLGVGVLTLIVCLFYSVFAPRMVYATRITDDQAWLGGVGKPFLDTLPDWPGK